MQKAAKEKSFVLWIVASVALFWVPSYASSTRDLPPENRAEIFLPDGHNRVEPPALSPTTAASYYDSTSEVASGSSVAPKGRLRTSELWGNPKTLADHFRRHGADFGAKTADDYIQQASRFFQRSQLDNLPTKVDSKGVIRVYDAKTNTFGSCNPDGTIKTFYKPDPALHKYPTNLDYWNAQPGTAPWTP